LCLKVPGTGIGDTTFPSKVVEIVANGLLLITMPVSDVPNIFKEDSAIILEDSYEDSLSDAILNVANNVDFYSKVASNGMNVAIKNFERDSVGPRALNFITE